MRKRLFFPMQALPDRKLRKDVCEAYGVKVSVDTSTGVVDRHYYPITKGGKVAAYKLRDLPKSFASIGDMRGKVELFGQSAVPHGGKKLLIVGGELDALSSYQMMIDKYPNFIPAVVSLPKGESTSGIADNMSFINKFDEIIIILTWMK